MDIVLRKREFILNLVKIYKDEFVQHFARSHKIKTMPELRINLELSFDYLCRNDGYQTESGPVDYETASDLNGAWCQVSYSVYYLSLMSVDDIKELVFHSLVNYFASVLLIENKQGSLSVTQLLDKLPRDFGYEPRKEWIPRTLARHVSAP